MIPVCTKQGSAKNLRTGNHTSLADPKKIISFIPGTVLDILVIEGHVVEKGDDLMIVDAMKMQNKLKSGIKGKIKKLFVKKGDKVSKGTVLIELE